MTTGGEREERIFQWLESSGNVPRLRTLLLCCVLTLPIGAGESEGFVGATAARTIGTTASCGFAKRHAILQSEGLSYLYCLTRTPRITLSNCSFVRYPRKCYVKLVQPFFSSRRTAQLTTLGPSPTPTQNSDERAIASFWIWRFRGPDVIDPDVHLVCREFSSRFHFTGLYIIIRISSVRVASNTINGSFTLRK